MKAKSFKAAKAFENPRLIFRKTLAYNDEAMLCSFELKKGGRIPLHSHRATQIGYVVYGKVQFLRTDGEPFEISAGDSYVFDSYMEHGAIALEDTMYVEVFTPCREEYKDF